MSITIRTLSQSDLAAADLILSSAFQRSESWSRELSMFQKLQPDGIFLAGQNGVPAGMVATIMYSEYAYVGLMGVHQDFQRQDIGLSLMRHVLAWMQAQGVLVVRLDASPFGQPLYERLGFVPFEEVYVLQRQKQLTTDGRPEEVSLIAAHTLDLLANLDTQAFGANRTRLLQALLEGYPGRAFMLQNKQDRLAGICLPRKSGLVPGSWLKAWMRSRC